MTDNDKNFVDFLRCFFFCFAYLVLRAGRERNHAFHSVWHAIEYGCLFSYCGLCCTQYVEQPNTLAVHKAQSLSISVTRRYL